MSEGIGQGIGLGEAAAPDGVLLFAVGDVHGRLDLLERMHARVEAEIAARKATDWRLVHVGDYVDRGPDSRGVIERLIRMRERDARVIALAGNHDAAFSRFLGDAGEDGLFRHHGGFDTARSYGVEFADTPVGFARAHERLVDAVPPEHRQFLATLPYAVPFGDFFFCHAGVRPGVALARQDPDDLLWIRNEFLRAPALHPKVIVHGHTPTRAVELRPNRVNTDTGAFQSGVLSAVVIDGREVTPLSVSL